MTLTEQQLRSLVLYGRADCHLCVEMHTELLAWQSKLDFAMTLVDIDTDADLVERYGHKVPVLVEGEEEICHFFLDEDMLVAHLAGQP